MHLDRSRRSPERPIARQQPYSRLYAVHDPNYRWEPWLPVGAEGGVRWPIDLLLLDWELYVVG